MPCSAQRAGNPGCPNRGRHDRGLPSATLRLTGLLSGVLLLLMCACSDSAAESLQQGLESIQEALVAGNDSAALQRARSVLVEHPDSPAALLGAAEACIGLKRFNAAAEYALAGLAGAEQDPALTADLHWARGAASLALYLELQAEADWRTANSSLERGASTMGTHRADAAYALVRMQGLDGMGNDGRRDRFGRMFLQIEPTGERADKVRAIIEGGDSR